MYQINKKNGEMISSTSKTSAILGRRYPVLRNFPFAEFELESANPPADSFFIEEDDEGTTRIIEPNLIKFVYRTPVKSKKIGRFAELSVVLFDKEFNWLCEIADKITDLDGISKTLDRAIKSDNLLAKRDAVEISQAWCSKIEDGRTRLSYSTISDILTSLVKNQAEFVSIVNKIESLSLKSGLVSLTPFEHELIMTYYQFQLIYAKLILGIVIASKISI